MAKVVVSRYVIVFECENFESIDFSELFDKHFKTYSIHHATKEAYPKLFELVVVDRTKTPYAIIGTVTTRGTFAAFAGWVGIDAIVEEMKSEYSCNVIWVTKN